MNAIVVYESLWGNTAQVAKAIAEGLGEGARALSTADADTQAVSAADLIVAGAPLLAFNLPTDEVRASILQSPQPGQPPADGSHPSMRQWLEGIEVTGGRFASFETRIWWSPGSSAKAIEKRLTDKGLTAIDTAQKFLVTGRYGPLKEGEISRAREWGRKLASATAG